MSSTLTRSPQPAPCAFLSTALYSSETYPSWYGELSLQMSAMVVVGNAQITVLRRWPRSVVAFSRCVVVCRCAVLLDQERLEPFRRSAPDERGRLHVHLQTAIPA